MDFKKTNRRSYLAAVVLCTLMGSCNMEKDLFDPEKTKEMYEKTFPVQNIDPSMDWKTSQRTQIDVAINEDWGTDYKIQIFDANPLNNDSQAKLIAEGYANQDMAFQTEADCPKALTTVFVARINEKGQYLVQPVAVKNAKISANFGVVTRSRAATRADASAVPTQAAPYTDAEIATLLAGATEVKGNWDLTANAGSGGAGTEPIFSATDRVFKITNNSYKSFQTNSAGKNVKLIIASDAVILPSSFNNSVEIIVAKGAKVTINSTLNLMNECRLIVMPGGEVSGKGDLQYANRSNGKLNYNGGTIDLKKLTYDGGGGSTECIFFNYGTLKLENYTSTTGLGTLVNRGLAYIGELNGNNNTDVKSACYLEVTNNLKCRNLLVGSNSMVKCGNMDHQAGAGQKIDLEKNAMIHCLGTANLTRQVTGPTEGSALFKMKDIKGGTHDTQSYITNNVICEVTNQVTNNGVKSDWSPTKAYTWTVFDWFVYGLLKNGATYCADGKANFMLPKGDCTGEGYKDDGSSDPVILTPITYTYAYEDNFPMAGDYDFNDIVFDVTPDYIRDAANKIHKIEYTLTLKAIGGIKMHGAGLRLVGIQKSQISDIQFTDPNNMRSTLGNSLFDNVVQEAADNAIVIPLFGDAHKIVGLDEKRPMLNTMTSGSTFTPVSMTFTLTLTDRTKTTPLLTNEQLDFFVAYPGAVNGPRTEVHLYEFRSSGATAKGTIHTENIAMAGKITWAVCVPGFKYPVETIVITGAYPLFSQWATTGGLDPEYADWYNFPTDQTDKKYIY